MSAVQTNHTNDDVEHKKIMYMTRGMLVGGVFGLIYGITFDLIAIGIPVGVTSGLSVGLAHGSRLDQQDNQK